MGFGTLSSTYWLLFMLPQLGNRPLHSGASGAMLQGGSNVSSKEEEKKHNLKTTLESSVCLKLLLHRI